MAVGLKLITEYVDQDIKTLTEEAEPGKPKKYYIIGPYIQEEVRNRNGRFYPSSVVGPEIQRYTKEFINEDRALGELGHPEAAGVNLERACIKILSLDKQGHDYIGKSKVVDHGLGITVKGLIDEGVKLGVSTRGIGSLEEKGGVMHVQRDFRLSAIDVVHDPSAPDAFVNGIMEGKEWIYENGLFREADLEASKRRVNNAGRNLETVLLEEFKKFVGDVL